MGVIEFDDIWVVEAFQDLYFVLKHLQSRSRKLLHLNYFNSIKLLVFADCFVDSAAVACSDLIREAIGVISNGNLILAEPMKGGEQLVCGATFPQFFGVTRRIIALD